MKTVLITIGLFLICTGIYMVYKSVKKIIKSKGMIFKNYSQYVQVTSTPKIMLIFGILLFVIGISL